MSQEHVHTVTTRPATNTHKHRRGHRLMMIAYCIPMLVIAITLVATGIVSASFLLFAVFCTAIMAIMMGGMGHGESGHK